jgi:hypothetical protein
VNLFPEKNQPDGEAPTTHYPRAGLTLLAKPPVAGAGRGLYWATNNQLYAVIGQNVYSISPTWEFTLLGEIGPGITPVSMVDDSDEILLVDGTPLGYEIVLATNAMTRITDPNFLGADRCDFVDTFLLSNIPGTQGFQSTLPNDFAWDPLYFASKTGFSDQLVTIICMHREVWLVGELTTEIWYNAGNSGFPFAILPGTFVEHGCVAKYTIAKHDLNIFFLSMDKDGKGVVVKGNNYRLDRISTHAIEVEFSKYPTLADASSYIYQQGGHIFYVINFPSADKTWAYDLQTGLWHEESWCDGDGIEHRGRVQCAAIAPNQINVALDWQNGNLYQIDPTNATDNGAPIVRRRGFPHLVSNGNRIHYACFRADIECGTAMGTSADVTVLGTQAGAIITTEGGAPLLLEGADQPPPPPKVYLRWSDDRGKTFGNAIGQSLGAQGQTLKQPQWRRLGMARDRVFELFWSGNFAEALNGAWIDALPMGS